MSKTVKRRQSNIELLRIFSMLLIIMNHYCGYLSFEETPYFINKVANIVLGSWGALGVDIFVIISVWYLCEKEAHFDFAKIIHLVLETIFYAVFWLFLGAGLGIVSLSAKEILKAIMTPALGSYWFVTAYICFYLLMPFLNKAINTFNDMQLKVLVLIFSVVVMGFQMLIVGNPNYGVISTFCYLYVLVSYLQRKPDNFLERHCYLVAMVMIVVICCGLFMGKEYKVDRIYYIFGEKYSIFLILLAISIFYIFKKGPCFSVGWINAVASTTFGVYLFHSGPIAQKFLSVDVARGSVMYQTKYFAICVIGYGLVILAVGILLDLLRKITLEKCIVYFVKKWTRGQRVLKEINDQWSMRI